MFQKQTDKHMIKSAYNYDQLEHGLSRVYFINKGLLVQ